MTDPQLCQAATIKPIRYFIEPDLIDNRLPRLGRTVILQPDAILCLPDETPDVCYHILEGSVTAMVYTAAGTERILYYCNPGCTVLVQNVLLRQPSDLSYKVAASVVAQQITRRELLDAIPGDTALTLDLFRSVFAESRSHTMRSLDSSQYTTAGRVCNCLLELAQARGIRSPNSAEVYLRLRQETLASLLGLHRITILNTLRELRSEGLVQYRSGNYCIPSLSRLIAYRDTQML